MNKPKVAIDIYRGLPEPLDLRGDQRPNSWIPVKNAQEIFSPPVSIQPKAEPQARESGVPGGWV